MHIKRSISFVLDAKKAKDGDDRKVLSRVRCCITWNNTRVRIGTELKVYKDGWESSLQRCRAKTFHGAEKTPASYINRSLDEIEEMVDGIFRSFEEGDVMPGKEQILDAYDRKINPDKYETDDNIEDESIFPIYDLYIREGIASGRWQDSTIQKNRTIRKHLSLLSPKLTFNELMNHGTTDMIQHFAKVKGKDGKGLSNRTIAKHISFVKTFLLWAIEQGYCEPGKFVHQRLKLRSTARPVIFLTWDELMRVYHYDFGSRNYLERVRDVFCFSCFTSLRYSDVKNLKRQNISDDHISITTVKTHDSIVIELNKYSKAILDKYKDVPFPNNQALPVISNQKMNDYLKIIGKECDIAEPITLTTFKGNKRFDQTYKKYELMSTHAGRRTFVCNALMLGISPNIVMKWTGHSDYKSMKPYIDIADDAKKNAMTEFDKK